MTTTETTAPSTAVPTALKTLGWGLPVPEATPAAWGARAIDVCHSGAWSFELLLDRQTTVGDADHVKALTTMLNGGILKACRAAFVKAKAEGKLNSRESGKVTLFSNWFVVVEADTRASCGYVYMSAWIRPEGHVARRVFQATDEPGVESPSGLPPGVAVWSHKHLPAVGTVLQIEGTKWASTTGRMTVLGHGVEHGHLFCVGKLDAPTPEWSEQVKAQPFPLYNCMGREWSFIPEAPDYTCECEADHTTVIQRKSYVVTGHDGTARLCNYCAACAELAAVDWNGETAAIEPFTA